MKPIGIINNPEEQKESDNITIKEVSELDILLEKMKAHLESKQIHLSRDKQSDWDSRETVKGSKAKADRVESLLKLHANDADIHVTAAEKEIFKDKYTRNEIDNKLSACNIGITWKETVNTTEEFVIKYMNFSANQEGDFVIVKNESKAYRFTNGRWQEMPFNIQPLATENTDGLMSKNDFIKLAGIQNNANLYQHPDNPDIRHVTDSQIELWNNKADTKLADYYAPGLLSAADKMKLDSLQVNGSVIVSRDISCPIIKDNTNTVTVGIATSNADYVCDDNTDFSTALSMAIDSGSKRIVILNSNSEYILDRTVYINKSDITITAENGVVINNRIHPDAPYTCAFMIRGSCNTISNITFKASSDDNIVSGLYAIKTIGNGNKFENLSIIFGNGIILDGVSNSIVSNCNISYTQVGIGVYSNKERASQCNRISNCNITRCKTGIDIYTFKNDNMYNIISDNIVLDCSIGINLYNISKTFNNLPTSNIIKFNIVSRGSGLPTDYEFGQYTIIAKASDTIFEGNITKGKEIEF